MIIPYLNPAVCHEFIKKPTQAKKNEISNII